jgi:hypothetical protein
MIRIFSKLYSQRINPILGRWQTASNYNIINKKIDFSNIDHCGCCDNANIEKIEEIDEKILSIYCYSDFSDLDTIKHKL